MLHIVVFAIIAVLLVILLLILALLYLKRRKPGSDLNWVNSAVYLGGFEYNPQQKVYQSRQDALQRLGGYSDLFDFLSVVFFMVIDVEPIYFSYDKKDYMIELWKGQYCVSSGSEIGVYIKSPYGPVGATGPDARYYCAPDSEMLDMSYNLQTVDTKKVLFSRSGVHWWLTGFLPGVFNQPENLALEDVHITFRNPEMAKAFYTALASRFNNDQKEYNYKLDGSLVTFRWHKTVYTPQPLYNERAQIQKYNSRIVPAIDELVHSNYEPDHLNDVILTVIKFLETNDNIDAYLNWVFAGVGEENCRSIAQSYDAANGTNMIRVADLFKVFSEYWATIRIPGLISYKAICEGAKLLKYKLPFCKYIVDVPGKGLN